jgi:aspartyl-tRNA(Asn)/glutamyl-tRNA(Gln) amidotransferase subunit A
MRPRQPPDAPAIARLRAAGAVLIGRSNMVEFAFGAVGTNPHYGTPKNPWDRKTGRVPGGSSSGAAGVGGRRHVRHGPGHGHARIDSPAGRALRHRRLQADGAARAATGRVPLSYTLDSIGPLANTAACCAAYDAVLAGESDPLPAELPARGLRLLLPRSSALEDLDSEVAKAFDGALAALSRAGAVIEERKVPAFDHQAEYFRNGGFAAAEAYAIHRRWSDRFGDYDPRVAKRSVSARTSPPGST